MFQNIKKIIKQLNISGRLKQHKKINNYSGSCLNFYILTQPLHDIKDKNLNVNLQYLYLNSCIHYKQEKNCKNKRNFVDIYFFST